MKQPLQNAKRWLREAEATLKQAEQSYYNKAYNLTCFLAEQTAQKALKAVMYLDGARMIIIHSVAELIKEISTQHPEFSALFNDGAKLDQHYLSSRYPDAVPEPAIPSEIYIEDQAKETLAIAKRILDASRSAIVVQ